MTSLCQNTADPLFMWIQHNYVNPSETSAPAWGASIYLGDPPQPFSIRPSIDDFSLVAQSDNCLGTTDYDCMARRGGVYNPSLSATDINSTVIDGWNGTIGTYDDTLFDYYNDLLTFGWKDTKVWGWPFVTDDIQDPWATRNWLGVGLNSSFLTAAVESGAAPTKSWGLWTGSRSIKNPQDGLLVLGGYDNARKGGNWEVFSSDDNCPTCIQISNMEWVTDNSSVSMFNGTVEAIQVSLDPWYDNIRLPQVLWESFGRVLNGTYDNSIGYFTWPAGQTPKGKMRVTLQGGYTSDIPAEEIFTMPRYYDSTGNYTISDNTTEFALVYNYTNTGTIGNAVGAWGLPFLTMNYLVLDVEHKEFWLTPAVRQNFGNEGGVFPRALCTGLATPTPTPTPSSTTTPTPPPTSSTAVASGSGGGTPVGPIVGGVVGGVGGIALIGLLAFLLLRRRSLSKKEAEMANTSSYPPAPPVQQVVPQQHYMGGPPPGPYSPTHTYPSPPFGNSAHNSMGYAGVPVGGFGGPQSDYSNDPQQHSGPQFYSPSPSMKPEHASMVYSDTATAVPELASPGQHNAVGSEWRSERDSTKDMTATVTHPFDGSWQEGPHQR